MPQILQLLNFLTFYGGRNLITVFTGAYSESDNSNSFSLFYFILLYYIIILMDLFKIRFNFIYPLLLVLPSVLFPSRFSNDILYPFRFSIRPACQAHLILLYLVILIILGEEFKLWRSSCSFLHPPVTSSLFGPSILPSTLFSNTLTPRCSFNVRNHVSNPYRIASKTILYLTKQLCYIFILYFIFVHSHF
jgi:hypothetical protein